MQNLLNGILTKDMAWENSNHFLAKFGPANTKMTKRKVMDHSMMVADILANISMISNTAMEFGDPTYYPGHYITESTKRVREKGTDISDGITVTNIGGSSRMTSYGEKESKRRREYYTKTNM